MSGENEMEGTSLNNANAPSQIELISRQCTKGEFSKKETNKVRRVLTPSASD